RTNHLRPRSRRRGRPTSDSASRCSTRSPCSMAGRRDCRAGHWAGRLSRCACLLRGRSGRSGLSMVERQSQQLRHQAIRAGISLTVLLLFGAYSLRELTLGATSPLLPYIALVPVIAPLWVFLLTFFGAYKIPAEASALDLTWSVVRAVATGLALTLALLFVLKIQHVSRVIIVSFAALDLVGLIGVRLAC